MRGMRGGVRVLWPGQTYIVLDIKVGVDGN